jgi:L-alanine-DL-glutamate epimerase-like enolase superfamily enzyme
MVRDSEQGRAIGLSLGESVKVYADRAGLTSDQKLADAARDLLPDGVAMNRRLVQQLQRDEIALGNGVHELQLIAIARACRVPATWLGVDLHGSRDLSKLRNLLIVPSATRIA